jgi:hypothetical protein
LRCKTVRMCSLLCGNGRSQSFTGFGKPDFEVAGKLRVRCGYVVRVITKNAYSYPQAYPQPRKVAGRMGKLPARLRVTCGYRHYHTATTVNYVHCHLAAHRIRVRLRAPLPTPPRSIVASSRLCSPRTLACRLPQPSVVVARLRGCSPSPSALHGRSPSPSATSGGSPSPCAARTLALRLPPRPPAFGRPRLRRLYHRSRHETEAISKRCDPVELHAAASKRTRRHRRSSTKRRESLCVGMLVLKIENSWASRDFVKEHRLSLAEIYCYQCRFGIAEIQVAGLPNRTLAGSLRVNFRLSRHCNARFGTRKLPATSIKIGFAKYSYYPANIHSNLRSQRLDQKIRASSSIQSSTASTSPQVNPQRSRKNAMKRGKNG